MNDENKTVFALALVGALPLLPIFLDPMTSLSLPTWAIIFLISCTWGYMFFLLLKENKQKLAFKTQTSNKIKENELLNIKILGLEGHSEQKPINLGLLRKIVEKDFSKVKTDLVSQISELKAKLTESETRYQKTKSDLHHIKSDSEKLGEELTGLKVENQTLNNAPRNTISLLELRNKELESKLFERDEQLNTQESLLRKILDLVPNIESQLKSVIDHTESSAIEIGDKVRFIYEKAQEHLAESNEINKQFSGKASKIGRAHV